MFCGSIHLPPPKFAQVAGVALQGWPECLPSMMCTLNSPPSFHCILTSHPSCVVSVFLGPPVPSPVGSSLHPAWVRCGKRVLTESSFLLWGESNDTFTSCVSALHYTGSPWAGLPRKRSLCQLSGGHGGHDTCLRYHQPFIFWGKPDLCIAQLYHFQVSKDDFRITTKLTFWKCLV